jgi:signal transduction histidine kinase
MTTMTGSASPLSEARWPATPTQVHLADPLLDALIHDIRTPLAAISAYAQLLLRRTATGKQEAAGLAEGLRQIEQAATRAGHLLDELTGHVRLSVAQGSSRQPVMTDLVDLVKRIASESQAAGLDGSRVVVLPAARELVGWWDPPRLERVVANLVDNALKYNRNASPIVVSVRQVDGIAVISVADRGVGIPAAELARVFERGYRASNVTGKVGGVGLGLFGSKEIVAEHGGTISLESRIAVGTTVTVRLPLGVPTR